VNADQGMAALELESDLSTSDQVRALHACSRGPSGAHLRYRLGLQRSSGGALTSKERFSVSFKCEDVVVECTRVSSTEPPP
jgi:hypothetical protein